jgi:hypothetical protein
MYAMVKKEKVSPIKLMAHYWLTILGLKKGGVTCTSWVTRIANGLGLLDNANIAYITTPRRVIDYSFFHHAHILKMRNRKIVMMYKGWADPVPEAPTRVGSRKRNNRSKVLPPQKFCRETALNPGPGDSAS